MLTDWFTSNKTAPWLPAVPAGTAWREVLWISRTSEVSLVSNHNHLLLRKMRLVQEEGWGELGGGGSVLPDKTASSLADSGPAAASCHLTIRATQREVASPSKMEPQLPQPSRLGEAVCGGPGMRPRGTKAWMVLPLDGTRHRPKPCVEADGRIPGPAVRMGPRERQGAQRAKLRPKKSQPVPDEPALLFQSCQLSRTPGWGGGGSATVESSSP